MSRDEAIRLVTTAGFTSWEEGVAFGTAARPYSRLSILGTADLQRMAAITADAKKRASGDPDAFEDLLDPSLAEFVNKVRENRLAETARGSLGKLLGPVWVRLVPAARDFDRPRRYSKKTSPVSPRLIRPSLFATRGNVLKGPRERSTRNSFVRFNRSPAEKCSSCYKAGPCQKRRCFTIVRHFGARADFGRHGLLFAEPWLQG